MKQKFTGFGIATLICEEVICILFAIDIFGWIEIELYLKKMIFDIADASLDIEMTEQIIGS